jgi:hypothetical protein
MDKMFEDSPPSRRDIFDFDIQKERLVCEGNKKLAWIDTTIFHKCAKAYSGHIV